MYMTGRKLSRSYRTDVCKVVPGPTNLSFVDIFGRK